MRGEDAEKDPYALLGVPRDASSSEIARAYRRLVRTHHPDTAPAPGLAEPALLARLVAAYAVLRDPARRAAYDQRHPAPRTVRGAWPPPSAAGPAQPDLRAGPVRRHQSDGRSGQADLRAGPLRWHPPTAPLLTVTLSYPCPRIVLCAVVGEVDATTAPQLRDRLQEATGNGSRHLVIDLSAVTFFGAAGLRVLLQARHALADGQQLVLASNSRPIVGALAASGLEQQFQRYSDVDSAIAACRASEPGWRHRGVW